MHIEPKRQAARDPYRGVVRQVLALCCGLLLTLAVAVPDTAPARLIVGSFGPDGTAATSFPSPHGSSRLAINHSVRRLFVLHRVSGADALIHGFDIAAPSAPAPAGGSFPLTIAGSLGVDMSGLAVDNTSTGSAGNIYAGGGGGTSARVYGFAASGASLGGNFPFNPNPAGFSGSACAAAVDSTGQIWTTSQGLGQWRLSRFSSAGNPLGSDIHTDGSFTACLLAVGANDDLYVGSIFQVAEPTVRIYTAASNYTEFTNIGPTNVFAKGIALDPITQQLYVALANRVEVYGPDGSLIETFADDIPDSQLQSVAVDLINHFVYVFDEGTNKVYVFRASAPAVTVTAPVSPPELTNTTAALEGGVNPIAASLSDCHFDYVTEEAFLQTGFADLSSGGTVPCNPSAASIPADDQVHDVTAQIFGLSSGTPYRFRLLATTDNGTGTAQGGFITRGSPKVETVGSPLRTTTSAQLNGRVNSLDAATSYHFEYGDQGPCEANPCASTNSQPAGSGNEIKLVASQISGLQPDTTYHYRLVADNGNADGPSFGEDMSVTTRADDTPLAHGGLQRLTVRASEGSFNLSFAGDTTPDLPFDTSAAELDAALETLPSIGAGNVTVSGGPGDNLGREPYVITFTGPFAGQSIPKLVAQSGTPPLIRQPGNAPGEAEIATLAGPPGSDRAYEQVSLGDSSGNPIFATSGFSDAGDRALYILGGGTPVSDYGTSVGSVYFAERNEASPHNGGWQYENITPPRSESLGGFFSAVDADSDLSTILATNFGSPRIAIGFWRLSPEVAPTKLLETPDTENAEAMKISADGSRTVVVDRAGLDPAYPGISGQDQLYDLSSGAPELLSLMPDGSVPACGAGTPGGFFGRPVRQANWITPDGSRVFFPSEGHTCNGEAQLYMRDLGAGTTTLISGPSSSGSSCGAALVKATPDAAFFWTRSRLVSEDIAPSGCGLSSPIPDGDVYRYDVADQSLDCLSCFYPLLPADVPVNASGGNLGAQQRIAIADDGSRVYFSSPTSLLPGAPADASYRLDVETGDLAYVAPAPVGGDPVGGQSAISRDGSVVVFRSDDPRLNAIGGQHNGGTAQYYRYDDDDRSLVCISCPADGSPPSAAVPTGFLPSASGPNSTPLSADGATVAFGTATPLIGADQNTPPPSEDPRLGSDVYEWRDGRFFLVTDGLLSWPINDSGAVKPPAVRGVSPSGNDIFFTVAARYTPDAVDGFLRLYDARIGGGFDFPPPAPPCSLEDCQGPASPIPTDPDSGSSTHLGPGNQGKDRTPPDDSVRCKKPKKRKGGKCVKPKKKKHRRNR
jgi:hypothetical protein